MSRNDMQTVEHLQNLLHISQNLREVVKVRFSLSLQI